MKKTIVYLMLLSLVLAGCSTPYQQLQEQQAKLDNIDTKETVVEETSKSNKEPIEVKPVVDKDMEEQPMEQQEICKKPYIEYKSGECCLDQNSNSVCDNDEDTEVVQNLKGIVLSKWYRSEQYGRDVIDIMNLDEVERTLNVTTICVAKNNITLPLNDFYVITIPANNKQTWVPTCPSEAISFSLDIKEIN